MSYFVYAISSKVRNYIYVGITNNLEKRIKQHNMGYNRSTKPYVPFELFYYEELSDRPSARLREKFLKNSFGKEFLKQYLNSLAGLSIDR